MSLAVVPTSHLAPYTDRNTYSTCLPSPSPALLSPPACVASSKGFIWEVSWIILNRSLILFVGFRMR